MNLYYYRDPVGNFGDDLNPWLWPQLFPCPLATYFDDQTCFIGIGSLLNHKIPGDPTKKVVFGSGYGYGTRPVVTDTWRIFCVRGPLTARELGLSSSMSICDSAILVRQLVEPAQQSGQIVSFMPHHRTTEYDDWRSVCEDLGVQYIDPADPVDSTLDAIRKSSLLITEAMHGAIVADALRVPWIPVRTRAYISEFKWQDWAASLDMEHSFEWLPRISNPNAPTRYQRTLHPLAASVAGGRIRWLIRSARRRLSRDNVFNQVYSRLTDSFDQLLDEAHRQRLAI